MEMMTQLPIPEAVVCTNGKCKAQKSDKDQNQDGETVSFPTMLQENCNALASIGSQKDATETGKNLTSGNSVPKGMDVFLPFINPESGTEIISESKLVSPFGEINTAKIQLPQVDSGKLQQQPGVPAIVEEVTSEEQNVAPKNTLPVTELTGKVSPLVETEVPSETAVPVETTGEATATPTANATAAPVDELNVPNEDAGQPSVSNEGSKDQLAAAKILQAIEPGKLSSIKIETKPQETKVEQASVENKNQPDDSKAGTDKIAIASALVEESISLIKPEVEVALQDLQDVDPEAEIIKVEVVKETSAPQASNTPVTENPALVRQQSAELDLLSAQANAQKTYQQPAVSAENGGTIKPTLADLDLDSGSFESSDQKDQSISRILSSMNDTSSPVKRSIRGQVLSRVVEHLQEEIGKEKLTIRLNPEKLGQVEILFKAENDKLNITMTSSGKDAEQAIQEGAKELAEKISENSVRYNLVEIKVENKGNDQQTKQDPKHEEKREKQGQSDQQQNEGHRSHGDHNQETGAGEWAAFHLGG